MFFSKMANRILDAIPPVFVYTFLIWLVVSVYTSRMNPYYQVEYLAKDIQCKIDGGFDWEAGEKGCYRKSDNGVFYLFVKAFGG